MNKHIWNLIDWIIGEFGLIFIISEPSKFFEPNLYEPNLYSSPYNIPQRIVGLFLIYCFLSVIYWVIKKKINMVVHYSLIIAIYIAIAVLYLIAVQSGI
ncbi:hypothetical protein [Paraclostridium sp. AKS73]|uniref:hypothetical protein n=1 Tax=Paraclostridium sp. AKS73 TaxID=2876116 RepID=UPI0021E0BECB|nr:hypothetical protein [Paraclostridium sp. AKS73]MCU9815806.1 hypothetical protein [Paraclostridium sp. AKS73]